jgi:hydroxymethylpyrimidine/phosphomethylpyrimidine kinase
MTYKRILLIAGSDSSGGAYVDFSHTRNCRLLTVTYSGLEADQKVVAAHGCYAMTATTALTAQNTTGVFGIYQTPPEFVGKQIDVVVGDVGVDIVKTGMCN